MERGSGASSCFKPGETPPKLEYTNKEEAGASCIQIAKGENVHKVSSPTLLFAISNATTQAFVAGTGETNQG
jgi:hypothetical protein